MDAVITYVDGRDPQWQKEYSEFLNVPALEKRYRDWGTLKYLLRGIETCMPFITNVYLVVSSRSQVPSWASSRLKVVEHKEIIPAEYLPTFNSTTIEMFLHRIPGLDEKFIYFNDDMFPVSKCAEEDFYSDGKSLINFSKTITYFGLYKKQVRNSDFLARKALGMEPSFVFVRPQHICSPMQKSQCEEVEKKVAGEILKSLSRTRTAENLNQYLFLDYLYYSGKAISKRISNKHFSLAAASIDSICKFLAKPTTKMACINDVQLGEEKYSLFRTKLLAAFDKLFPVKSSFEL